MQKSEIAVINDIGQFVEKTKQKQKQKLLCLKQKQNKTNKQKKRIEKTNKSLFDLAK